MKIVVEADRLFDGTGAAVTERAAVLIRDGRVEAVGTRDQLGDVSDAERVEYHGLTKNDYMIGCPLCLAIVNTPGPQPASAGQAQGQGQGQD